MRREFLLIIVMLVALAFVRVIPVRAWVPTQFWIAPPQGATIDLGQSERFCGGVVDGSGNYSHQWYVNGTAAPSVNSSLWFFPPQSTFGVNSTYCVIFTPLSTGSYMISFAAEDLSNDPGVFDYVSAILIVGPPLSVSMSPSSNVSMYVGQSQTFAENTSGGTALSCFNWFLNDASGKWLNPPVYMQEWANSSSWTFTPTRPGTYEIACTVIDCADCDFAYNASQIFHNSYAFVTVNPAPIPDPPRGWSLFFLYLRSGVSSDGWFCPWSSHFPIPL